MKIERLDHLVLTVTDMAKTIAFYQSVLGMMRETFANGRVALKFGSQKINLHEVGREFEPKSLRPTPGSADLCFVTSMTLNEAMEHVKDCGVDIIQGPVQRTGANGPLLSFYFRDPDGNLVEVATEKDFR